MKTIARYVVRAHWILLSIAVGVLGAACTRTPRALPRNPVLEHSRAHLDAVEARVLSKGYPPSAPADCLELGIATYQVWEIYLSRSRYPAYTSKARDEAERNRRMAERLQPKVIDAFQRATDSPTDPVMYLTARLVRAYPFGGLGGWAVPAQEVYVEPVRVALPAR